MTADISYQSVPGEHYLPGSHVISSGGQGYLQGAKLPQAPSSGNEPSAAIASAQMIYDSSL
jgi:hypothetical protein